jgi:hypothetical protein
VVEKVYTATWLAIGWVALEVIASWVRVWLAARDRRRASVKATGTLPAA